jgi:predicted nucleic acid-binding protein
VILIDTSVWVAATRDPSSPASNALGLLIDTDEALLPLPVRLELLAGVARKDRTAFTRALSALPVVAPSEETWRLIEGWIEPAANRGHRFALTDLLIAGLAYEVDALVWSLDADFERMESLKMVRLYSGSSTIRGAQR